MLQQHGLMVQNNEKANMKEYKRGITEDELKLGYGLHVIL